MKARTRSRASRIWGVIASSCMPASGDLDGAAGPYAASSWPMRGEVEGPMHAVENGVLLIVVVAAGTLAARRLLLAVGLTLVSTVAVGLVAHAVIPGLPLAAALALGAILAPPDAVSATAVARRTGLPRRIVTVLEGESLLNDATALVAYRVAVAAAVIGVFSPAELSWRFALASVGGAVVGLAVALAVDWLRRRIDDPIIDNTMSLVAPFAAYLPAEVIGASGVLAVVVTGLYLGYQAPVTMTAASRLVSKSVWKVVEFLLQGTVFTLIGLQLREVLAGLRGYDPGVVVVAALAMAGAVVGVRFVWMFPVAYGTRLLARSREDTAPRSWRE